ncbi:MAG TPA: glycoside hydrolase family 38 C-terminal domain-containing protein [Terracidiphilus sp.]|nr:glycoside hydrolase family 38 C-terminal domain-containing protein [Terracidiphilus sp.]
MKHFFYAILAVCLCAAASPAVGQVMQASNLEKQPTLYVVPYAHLDTQWRWDFRQTISEYLLKTMRVNFDYIEKYPHYVINWTGANRYRLMKEYYPRDYARLTEYVARGNWFPAGSSVEEGDVNLPSAESIFRQILYGNEFFRKEFGKASDEYMLPDCFGFPASLPTILNHAGIKGFSTQKLSPTWQPAPRVGGPGSPENTTEGIPFNVGLWKGPDGSTVIAALNPGRYSSRIRYDLSKIPTVLGPPPANWTPAQIQRRASDYTNWPARIALDGKVTGVYADYRYVGVGDRGGATDEETVRMLEAIVTRGRITLPRQDGGENDDSQGKGAPVQVGDGPVKAISSAADQMFNDITPEMTNRMPVYEGDLELINHTAGSLTSEAYHKRWNRKNEILADSAEKASVAAVWMGGLPYPQLRLNDAWMLVLAGQFHDTAAGTSTPRAYQYAWNDDVIALNQFADVLTSATQSVAAALDTEGKGIPLVVYNSLDIARQDVVEAKVSFPGAIPAAVRVIGPDGREVPSQIEGDHVLFLADTPSVGYSVYNVQRAAELRKGTELRVTPNSLENARYRVTLNDAGDVASIFDKLLNKELLSAPIRLAISNDSPREYPAWNMGFDQEQAAPRAYVSGPAKIRIVEQGPVRVAIEVQRQAEGSRFVQTVRLSAGKAGDRVEFNETVDWRLLSANLKAVFPLAASNTNATYNWEVGTVERPTANDRQFEVPSHYWIDLTDKSGSYGATVLTDVKNASDKRDDHTIRVTLLRTPGLPAGKSHTSYDDQLNQDWGHHEILLGIAGHAGDWRKEQTDWQGYRLSTPLQAFETTKHEGALGKSFSLVKIENPQIRVLALKKAENSNEIVLRLVEQDGKPAPNIGIQFAAPIAAAREVNGQEMPVGAANVSNGVLRASFMPYQPRTFALRLAAAPVLLKPVESKPVALHYDLPAASGNDTNSVEGGFDGKGNALAAEMLPPIVQFNGIEFQIASSHTDVPDALVARGQTIPLPAGDFNRVYLLAASAEGDQKATFKAGDRATTVTVQDWGGFIGQWDTRLWKPAPDFVTVGEKQVPLRKNWAVSATHATWDIHYNGSRGWSPSYPEDYLGLEAGYIKRAALAWYSDHYHTPEGLNEPYGYSYLFGYSIELPQHATALTLPNNDKIRILAVSVAREPPQVIAAQPLYDSLDNNSTQPGDYTHAAGPGRE